MQDTQGISRGQLCYCLAVCNRDTFTMRKLSCNELKLQNDSSRENFYKSFLGMKRYFKFGTYHLKGVVLRKVVNAIWPF